MSSQSPKEGNPQEYYARYILFLNNMAQKANYLI